MSDWTKSSTKWFVADNGPGIVSPVNPRALLAALEQMGREAGMCMTRNPDNSMCYQPTPCEAHPSPTPGKVAG